MLGERREAWVGVHVGDGRLRVATTETPRPAARPTGSRRPARRSRRRRRRSRRRAPRSTAWRPTPAVAERPAGASARRAPSRAAARAGPLGRPCPRSGSGARRPPPAAVRGRRGGTRGAGRWRRDRSSAVVGRRDSSPRGPGCPPRSSAHGAMPRPTRPAAPGGPRRPRPARCVGRRASPARRPARRTRGRRVVLDEVAAAVGAVPAERWASGRTARRPWPGPGSAPGRRRR